VGDSLEFNPRGLVPLDRGLDYHEVEGNQRKDRGDPSPQGPSPKHSGKGLRKRRARLRRVRADPDHLVLVPSDHRAVQRTGRDEQDQAHEIHRYGGVANPSHPPHAKAVIASPLSNRRIMPGDVNHRSALFTPTDANAATDESFCPTAQVIHAAVTMRLPKNRTAPRMCRSMCHVYGNSGSETTIAARIAMGGRGAVRANSSLDR